MQDNKKVYSKKLSNNYEIKFKKLLKRGEFEMWDLIYVFFEKKYRNTFCFMPVIVV